ncbi:MAG: hypothetical protein CME71_07325 [Halobacteriovorax sp.]|nr:hypothetical protein [Halobacteriovorax sp.]
MSFFKNSHSGYHDVRDGSQIYFCTNFPHKDFAKQDKVLVFNYGLVCSNEHWRYQLPYFDELGYKILIHDYRHHFMSKGAGGLSTCTFKNIASDLKEVISLLDIRSSILLGHSMGVNVCLEYARLWPDDVHSMILMSGTVFPPQDVMFDSNAMEILTPLLTELKGKAPGVFDLIWRTSHLNPLAVMMTHDGGFNKEKVNAEMIKLYLEKVGELSVDLFLQLFSEMKKHNIISSLGNIDVPSLIIGGDKDKVIPNYLQRILVDHLKNAEMYIVKDGSHVPQWDFPHTINEVISDFID